MVLIDSKRNPKATYEFCAEFIPYSNNSQELKISPKYEPVINTLTTRQICDIVTMKDQEIEESLSSLKLFQKKSKSIDINQKGKIHKGSLSSLKNTSDPPESKKLKNKTI